MLMVLALLLLAAAQTPQPIQGEPPQDVSLFARARKYANFRLEPYDQYAWLHDNSILVGVEGRNKPIQFSSYGKVSSDKLSLKNLNRTMAGVWNSYMYSWHLSPDRNRLLLVFRNQGYVVEVNNSSCREVVAMGYHSNSFWLSDSRRWIHSWHGSNGSMLDYPVLTVHDSFDSKYKQNIENSKSNPLQMGYGFAISSVNNEIVTVVRHQRSEDEDRTSGLVIYRRSLKQKNSRSRSSYIDLELKGKVTTVALSPDCQKIAVIQSTAGLPLSNRKHKDVRPVATLWISRTDGRKAQIVGCFLRSEKYDFDRLEWLPGGKTLSFVYRHELYTVPANGPDFSQFVSPAANRAK